MTRYVSTEEFMRFAYIDEADDAQLANIMDAIEAAEEEVNNDLDYACLEDYEDEDGRIPAPLRKCIKIKALQSYDNPDGMSHSGVTLLNAYEKAIKPYVKLTPKE